jgi:DNA-binding response OmpR family regulator
MMVVAVGITSEELRPATSPLTRGGRMPGLMRCLVVTGERGFRNRLHSATELAGWEECDAPESSVELQSVVDEEYQLVLVDIANPLGERVSDTVELAEEFASRPGTLVVVCGPEDGIDEELWARQLGAWVYLPGAIAGDGLISLCTEAGRLADRRGAFVTA